MKEFNFDITTDKKCIIDLGEALSADTGEPVILSNNGIIIPPALGEGRIEMYELEIGLSLMTADCKFNTPMKIYRNPIKNDDYFWININLSTTEALLKMEEGKAVVGNTLINAILVTTNRNSIEWNLSQSNNYKGLFIIAHRSWIKGFLSKYPIPITIPKLQSFLNYEPTQFFVNLDITASHIAEDVLTCTLPSNSKSLYFHGAALNLFALFLKKIVETELSETTVKSDEAIRILQLTEMIEHNLDEPVPTIDEFAKKCLMGKTKFLSVFKTLYGKNFSDIFLEIKMKQAAMLLAKGESVSDVGYKIGYTNLGFFAKTFKEFYQDRPKDYQKKHYVNNNEE